MSPRRKGTGTAASNAKNASAQVESGDAVATGAAIVVPPHDPEPGDEVCYYEKDGGWRFGIYAEPVGLDRALVFVAQEFKIIDARLLRMRRSVAIDSEPDVDEAAPQQDDEPRIEAGVEDAHEDVVRGD